MSTASRDCGIPSGARARWFNAPPVPGSSDEPRGHYDLRASRQLGLPQGLRALRKQEETSPQGGFLKSPRPKCQPESQIAAPASGRSRPFLNIQVCVEPGSGTPLHFFSPTATSATPNFIITEGDQRDGLSPRRAA